ncbi:biopolymer transporter ExbD [uncultured Arcticibacterium sp.]|uniref:ExbD/TolR family protein n=1 Tax=uncultured Arcticibacterium sp. TaxID=2173042 RepID=UPI0030F6EC60
MAEVTNKKSGKPDMTPLVDLGFLLITFFIYTTTFSTPNTMDLNMPSDKGVEGAPIKKSNSMTVILGKDNKLYWHQEEIGRLSEKDIKETNFSPEGIRKTIIALKKEAIDPELWTVIIKPTDDSNWKNAVDILDETAITGSSRKAVVELSQKEQKLYERMVY